MNHQPPTDRKCPFRAEVEEMQSEMANPSRSSAGAFPLIKKIAEWLIAMHIQKNDWQQQLGSRSIETTSVINVNTMPIQNTSLSMADSSHAVE